MEFLVPLCLLQCLDTNLKQNEVQIAHAESTRKGVNWRSKYVTQIQQQRPESPVVTLTWHAYKYKVHKLHQRCILQILEDVPLVEFMSLVFTHMPGEILRMHLWWSLCTLYLHACQVRFWGCTSGGVYVPCIYTHARWDFEDVPLVEFMYLVFTRMPGESYHRQPRSLLLYLCYLFQALINSFVCWFCLGTPVNMPDLIHIRSGSAQKHWPAAGQMILHIGLLLNWIRLDKTWHSQPKPIRSGLVLHNVIRTVCGRMQLSLKVGNW